MIENPGVESDERVFRFVEEYFKRFNVRLNDGEILEGCRLLVWGRTDLVLQNDEGGKYLVPRRSIAYITLQEALGPETKAA